MAHRHSLFIVALIILQIAGCATYSDNDSVIVVGVEKRPSGGYERVANRVTRQDDKYFQFSIGEKRLVAYDRDKKAASEAISKQVLSERGYCPGGYTIVARPDVFTGSYGYYWFVECK